MNFIWKVRNSVVIASILIVLLSLVSCENRERLIQYIAEWNVYECELVGFAGEESEVYKAFEKVKAGATNEELILLMDHDSLAVATYASIAVLQKELLDPVVLFEKHVHNASIVRAFCGCQFLSGPLIDKLYFEYLYKLRNNPGDGEFPVTDRREPESITKIDSLILHANVEHQFLIGVILEKDKKYSDNSIVAIEKWAFDFQNIHALEYIYEHRKSGNEEKLVEALTSLKDKKDKKEKNRNGLYYVNLNVVKNMLAELTASS